LTGFIQDFFIDIEITEKGIPAALVSPIPRRGMGDMISGEGKSGGLFQRLKIFFIL
jgi:antitoxin (DNA-binding transcriptional repressor) of toxin-antitoxin stability system